jgi:FtsZ-interacting cell division protein ZipA
MDGVMALGLYRSCNFRKRDPRTCDVCSTCTDGFPDSDDDGFDLNDDIDEASFDPTVLTREQEQLQQKQTQQSHQIQQQHQQQQQQQLLESQQQQQQPVESQQQQHQQNQQHQQEQQQQTERTQQLATQQQHIYTEDPNVIFVDDVWSNLVA